MSKHANGTRMAVQSPEEQEYQRKYEELVRKLDNEFRPRLREGLSDMKRSTREVRPGLHPDTYSQILAGRTHPTRQLAEALVPMMLGGAERCTMMVLGSVLVEWIKDFYATDVPPLRELTSRLAVEAGEASAESIRVASDPSVCQLQRTEKEVRDVRVLAEYVETRLAQDIRTAGSRPSLTLAGR